MTIAPVVDAGWVADHGDGLVLADVRWYLDGRSGRAEYDAGHLPGAVFVDLDRVLAAPPDDRAGRHPLPDPDAFADGMAALGIGDDDTVVAYDDAGGVIAARLVWMLRVTGHEAALLDGGLTAWRGDIERAPAGQRPGAAFTARPWPVDRLATIDDAAKLDEVLLDARPRERYRGGQDPVDPRSGHIPGAHSLPCRENVDETGRFLDAAQLRARFADVGVSGKRTAISYCGSGVTACHTLLALEHAGLAPGRLYPGSWSQWSRDPSRPVAVGDAPD